MGYKGGDVVKKVGPSVDSIHAHPTDNRSASSYLRRGQLYRRQNDVDNKNVKEGL